MHNIVTLARPPLAPSGASVVAFRPNPAAGLPTTAGRFGEYALGDIARVLRLSHFDPRTIIQKLRVLADQRGMPLPRTPRIVRGRTCAGPDSIYRRSRWDAGEFDAWISDFDPDGGTRAARPAAKGEGDDARPRVAPPIRQEMRRRAAALGGGR